ncbi:MAG: zinc ribbon domain-containing protein [Patescibacteria group bacterium]
MTLNTSNCRECGEELKAGADFCTQCGAKVSTIATVPEQLTYCNQCGAILQEDKTNQSSMLVLGCLGACVAILGIILCATVILFIIGFPMAILGGLLAGYGFTLLVKNSAKKKFICPKCHISFPRSDAN